MNGRTTLALAVLAAAGLMSTDAGRDALEAVVATANAQQAGESEQQADRERDTRQSDDAGAETEIARAAGPAAPGTSVTALTVERSEHGRHIADQDGRALYLLESESNGESQCYDECAEQWPPALTQGGQNPAIEGRRVDESLLGTFERDDGSTQVTYGDYPLYYYVEDQEPGDVTGHDVHDEWGGWYLVTPEGEPLESEEGSSEEGASEERG